MTTSSISNSPQRLRHTLILGGTFDPPHLGHISPLLTLLNDWAFDECWLMPNHIPPHKQGPHASINDRLTMLESLCKQYPKFSVCKFELERDEPSYTVKTLAQLNARYPTRQFYFVMGMDSFLNLPSWYEWQSLFSLCHIVLCARPGYQLSPDHPMTKELETRRYPQTASTHLAPLKTALPSTETGCILVAEIDELDVSSSAIRLALQQGNAIPNVVPESVATIIHERRLYR